MTFKRNILACVFFLLCCPTLLFAKASPKTTHFTLDNGLNIFVRQIDQFPVVATQVWYRIGSVYEHNGMTGVSHVLEHMMFKGTPKYPNGKLDEMLTLAGAKHNAFTSYDITAYVQELGKQHLETAFILEADRMRNLTFHKEDFIKEMRVVKEERSMRTDDNPVNYTRERFLATAHISTPNRHPIIGWPSDLDALTIENAKKWYQKWYVPNNASVVVVGDVDPQAVLALAKKHFGPIPSRPIPTLKPQAAMPYLGTRHIEVHRPAKIPHVFMGYNLPNFKQAEDKTDIYALEVLANILAMGRSARLESKLVQEAGLLSSVTVSTDCFQLFPDLFTISASPADSVSTQTIEQAITREIQLIQEEGVSSAEVQKIKQQMVAQKVFAQDSLQEQAMMIGWLESIGLSYSIYDEFIEGIQKVTPKQVQQVAKKYLVPNRLTVATLVPQDNGIQSGVSQ